VNENEIRARAFLIWQREGKPEGRALQHWLAARWELENFIPAPQRKDDWRHGHLATMAEAGA
jgi:hypothetical protein